MTGDVKLFHWNNGLVKTLDPPILDSKAVIGKLPVSVVALPII